MVDYYAPRRPLEMQIPQPAHGMHIPSASRQPSALPQDGGFMNALDSIFGRLDRVVGHVARITDRAFNTGERIRGVIDTASGRAEQTRRDAEAVYDRATDRRRSDDRDTSRPRRPRRPKKGKPKSGTRKGSSNRGIGKGGH